MSLQAHMIYDYYAHMIYDYYAHMIYVCYAHMIYECYAHMIYDCYAHMIYVVAIAMSQPYLHHCCRDVCLCSGLLTARSWPSQTSSSQT
jgi:hypothetical protein